MHVEPAINLTLVDAAHMVIEYAEESVPQRMFYFLAYVPERARVLEIACSDYPDPQCGLYDSKTDQAMFFDSLRISASEGELPAWTRDAVHESSNGFEVPELCGCYVLCKDSASPPRRPVQAVARQDRAAPRFHA